MIVVVSWFSFWLDYKVHPLSFWPIRDRSWNILTNQRQEWQIFRCIATAIILTYQRLKLLQYTVILANQRKMLTSLWPISQSCYNHSDVRFHAVTYGRENLLKN
jgi:hypothetical protein